MIGQTIQNYTIESKIGEGGMGDVYLAKHILLDKKVAIKMLNVNLSKHKEFLARFDIEARTLNKLKSKYIVELIDYNQLNGVPYLIMEYVEGTPLDDFIKKISGPIPESRAIKYMLQILEAVDTAHKAGIIHRDLKPSNFILTQKDDIKILDFGIAKMMSETENHQLTKMGQGMGTLPYMSPEQILTTKLENTSDIYSLGVCLHHFISGKEPYNLELTRRQIEDKIIQEPLERIKNIYPFVSEKIQAIVDKATEKQADKRFQSCSEFAEALQLEKTISINSNSDNILLDKSKQNIVNRELNEEKQKNEKTQIVEKTQIIEKSVIAETAKNELKTNNKQLENNLNEQELPKIDVQKNEQKTVLENKKSNKNIFIFSGILILIFIVLFIFFGQNNNKIEEVKQHNEIETSENIENDKTKIKAVDVPKNCEADFKNGLAIFIKENNKNYGILNENCDTILSSCNKIEWLKEGTVLLAQKDGKFALIHAQNPKEMDFKYKSFSVFSKSLKKYAWKAENFENKSIVFFNNEFILTSTYQSMEFRSFWGSGYYVVAANGKKGIFSKEKGEILACNYQKILWIDNFEYFWVQDVDTKKWGAYNKDGKLTAIQMAYEEDFKELNSNLLAVKKNGMWGVVSMNGQIKLNFEYQAITKTQMEKFSFSASHKSMQTHYFDANGNKVN